MDGAPLSSSVANDPPPVASPPLNIVPLASSDANVQVLAPVVGDDVQDHSSFDLVAQMPAAVLLGEFDEAASSSDSVAQVTHGVRDESPANARGAPVPEGARVLREDAPVGARVVTAPVSARGVREAETVVDLQARSQAIKHQRTMIDVDQPVFEVVCALPASFSPPSCPQATVSESAKNKRKKGKGKGQNGPFFTESPQVSPPLASPSKRGKNVDADGFTQIENKRSLRSRGKVTNPNVSQ
ncbi:hypothetical protein DCAR_0622726 [Daucus carota subsp. sativus]|uniref:Uncharacterized protein n=1 Tax=Daucus carota subsp. sativus TaxID=79200 RepID=A0A175YAU7_DAUCS|nr:hypothetical protein DCAR_0622726 [Daucus carota subsp. sativus]